MSTHTAELYVQVEPQWGWASSGNDKPVHAIRAVGLTQKRPAKPRSGTVVVKLVLEIPDRAFLPLRPEATVVIPADLTDPHPIVVEAIDPNGDQ